MGSVILVVEDQAAMQRNIRIGLEMAGYDVVTAADGIEALAMLGEKPVDLILADIAMPRMNGYQLYEQLRQNRDWALIPFVFISARALDSDVRYGKALGADDYLVKPFQLEDLLAIVAGRLRRAREVTQAVALSAASEPPPAEDELIIAGPLRIHSGQHRVWKDGEQVELSPREFVFLEYLARRPGQAVPLSELCQVTHGLATDAIEAGNLLYSLVRSLRRRLGYAAGEMGCIRITMGKRPSVLIVEARHNTRTFLELTLSQAGVQVFSAVNLASALLQLRVLQPDLIILGLGQGDHEESAALAQIRALSPSPLLALGDGADAASQPGIAAILPYPYQVGQLCATVAQLLEGRDEPRLGRCECGAGDGAANGRM